jgi:hypothetical protein
MIVVACEAALMAPVAPELVRQNVRPDNDRDNCRSATADRKRILCRECKGRVTVKIRLSEEEFIKIDCLWSATFVKC